LVEFAYTLTTDDGLHARPAGNFAKKTQGYAEKITVAKGDKSVDAKRLFSVLSLKANRGDEIIITVEGDDENNVADELKKYCASVL